MLRLIAPVGIACLGAAAVAFAQGSPANAEAHHKRALYTNDIRVFDVLVPPGETTADHVHEFDMATVILADGTLQIRRNDQDVSAAGAAGRGTVIVSEQTGTPATYRIQNTGSTPYHVLEIENMREGGGWLTPKLLTAPATSVQKESRAFTVYDVTLKADTPEVAHVHTWSTVVILIDGLFEAGGIGGEDPLRIARPGQWLPFPRGQSHTLKPLGGDAHVIEIEAR